MSPDSLKTLFGKNFRKAREDKKLSRAALALRLDISPKTIQSWEMGRTFIEDLTLIPSIESELGVSFTALLRNDVPGDATIAAESAAPYGQAVIDQKTANKVLAGPQLPTFNIIDPENPDGIDNAYIAVPLVKAANADKPVSELVNKDIVKYTLFPAEWCPRGRVLVAFKMVDSSLDPCILQGSTVLVDRRIIDVERLHNRVAAIWLADRGLRIRRIELEDGGRIIAGNPEKPRKRGRVIVDESKGDFIIGRVLGSFAQMP